MHIPRKAQEALKDLGLQIRLSRKRRLLTLADLAQKMGISPPTLIALEKGQPTVSTGVLVSALWILGLEKNLLSLSNPTDPEGMKLADSRLPKRVRRSKKDLDNDF